MKFPSASQTQTNRRIPRLGQNMIVLLAIGLANGIAAWVLPTEQWLIPRLGLGTGVALALQLLWGPWIWPGTLVGFALANFSPAQTAVSLVFTPLLYTTAVSLGWRLLHHTNLSKSQNLIEDWLWFSIIGAVVIPAFTMSTTVVLLILLAVIDLSAALPLAEKGFLSEFLGILLTTPLILGLSAKPDSMVPQPNRWVGIVLVSGTTLILIKLTILSSSLLFLFFPLLYWIVNQYGFRATTLFNLLVTLTLSYLISRQVGAFVDLSTGPSLQPSWLLICTLVLTGLWGAAIQRERNQLTAELGIERQTIANLLNQVGQGISVLDAQFRFEFVNPALANMLGLSETELLGRPVFDFVYHEDRAFLESTLQIRIQGEVSTYEIALVDHHGEKRPVLISGVPRHQNGRFLGTSSLIVNLTEIKQKEQNYQQLLRSAQRQQQALQLLDDVQIALAKETELQQLLKTVVNTIHETFGYPLVSIYLIEGEWCILQHGRSTQKTHDAHERMHISEGVIGRVLHTKQPCFVEDVHRDPDYISDANHPFANEICVPLFNRQKIRGVLNIEGTAQNPLTEDDFSLMTSLARHISIGIERASLVRTVKRNQHRNQILLQHNPSTITLLDEAGNRMMSSPFTQHILGKEVEEWLNHTIFEEVHPDDLQTLRQTFTAVLEKEETSTSIEYRAMHHSGEWRWISATFTNLLAEPLIGAVVANKSDITDKKRAEEAFQQAQKLESLGVLAGGIAHDFNNYLSIILGQLSVAQYKVMDDVVGTHLEKAQLATERAAELTQQLLAYAGQGKFKNQPFELNNLLSENLHFLTTAVSPTVTLTSQLAADLPYIYGDKGQIQQIIVNLMLNAADAFPQKIGNIAITTGFVHLTAEEMSTWAAYHLPPQPGNYVTLTIFDNGNGMTAEILHRIFDPFFTTKETGHGLGLAAVQGIMRSHNGGLYVKSAPGQGSEFTLYFPIYHHETPSDGITPKRLHSLKSDLSITVLVIDDDTAVLQTIEDMLTTAGLSVFKATNGHDGILLFKENQYQIGLVILDLTMPGLSGEQTLQQLHHINPFVPVLLSSGYTQTALHQTTSAQWPVVGFLKKPYDATDLLTAVQQLTTQDKSYQPELPPNNLPPPDINLE